MGQGGFSSGAWESCESTPLQPHWVVAGTSAHSEPVPMPCGPIAACYMSCVPGAPYQADAVSSTPYVSDTTKDVGIGRLVNTSNRQKKPQGSSTVQVCPPSGQISPAEWAARRHEITDLYRFRGWTLARVMEEMARRGFHAS